MQHMNLPGQLEENFAVKASVHPATLCNALSHDCHAPGGSLPDLQMLPAGSSMLCAWTAMAATATRVRHVEHMHAQMLSCRRLLAAAKWDAQHCILAIFSQAKHKGVTMPACASVGAASSTIAAVLGKHAPRPYWLLPAALYLTVI